jgi:hypothetical protein
MKDVRAAARGRSTDRGKIPSGIVVGKEMRVTIPGRRTFGGILVGLALMAASITLAPRTGGAVEVGEPAPDFTLPSTNGVDISLSDFRGKKWVFLEFYAAAFVPT